MNARAITLDVEKFRKVYAHVTNGVNDGERDNAKRMAEAMAAKAGMSLNEAVSKMDAAAKPKSTNIFEGFDDWMEEKEPGYKAKRAREQNERERRYQARRDEILKQFGSVKAFFDPTPLELLLKQAGKPFVAKRKRYTDICGTRREYADVFAGVDSNFFQLPDVDPAAIDAIKGAYPFPPTICEAFEELKAWDKLNDDRAHFFDHHEYYFDLEVELRIELLRDVMKTQPVASWDDLDARFHYKSYEWEKQWIDERSFEDPEWSRLFADIQILRAMAANPIKSGWLNTADITDPAIPSHRGLGAQNGRRTNAAKAADVQALLRSNPELSDREISRRAGVSPQTVSNWRARLSQTELFPTEGTAA
ncbi:winged helix-turn-helix domain-containing protein [Rhizobium sp. P32RR-XVIII]|uniref:winged helix-turn-helix domain-containing protein n=1 Tax=Rhizobium sp. P32RR-XVIII TaxID=2726738 RepID=UPI0014574C1B|nr:winged helix-turn-helix domain-containing protein [Rhizobium sp. P32RR-XVIII]NLS07630.1 winged helix-turn-helix domain-containing protein [Rhizobium sp. P32RR-XVIII]